MKTTQNDGYAPGNIFAISYDLSGTPVSDEEMSFDLGTVMDVYENVGKLIGTRSMDEFYDSLPALVNASMTSTVEEQEITSDSRSIAKIDKKDLNVLDAPKTKGKTRSRNGQKVFPRDSKVSAAALICADFTCEIDPTHISFTSGKSHQPYMEAHHLIPLANYEEFSNSIDIEANVVSLCPNCHRKLHYAVQEEKKDLIQKLWKKREKRLEKCGITIDLDRLMKMYSSK